MKKYFNGANSIECEKLSEIGGGQDGAIYDNTIFHFNHKGECVVKDFSTYEDICKFNLDKLECIIPHSNSVCFSKEKFEINDRFPLLYANVYNNYSGDGYENHREGECCVYRIMENQGKFSSKLLQVIKIGFVESELWKSKNGKDVRPYGNFVVDTARNRLIAFTMRDEDKRTRFFEFNLPKITSGKYDKDLGVNLVTLSEADILARYDVEYTRYMQGAICYDGYIYVAEGFLNDKVNIPAIRIINVAKQKMVAYYDLTKMGLHAEPEFVEIYNDKLFYADFDGRFYSVTFKKD